MEVIVTFQSISECGSELGPVRHRGVGGFLTYVGKVTIQEGLFSHFCDLKFLKEEKHRNGLFCAAR